MTEQNNTEQAKGKFNLVRIYIKDISFEAPNSPQIFNEQWQPANSMDMNTGAQKIADNIYEVVLSVTVTVKNGEQTAFLVEVHQAGIFQIEGFDDEHLEGVLGSFCPSIIFPYAREAVSDIVARGGFPQLLLAPINFDVLYMQHKQKQAAAKTDDAKH